MLFSRTSTVWGGGALFLLVKSPFHGQKGHPKQLSSTWSHNRVGAPQYGVFLFVAISKSKKEILYQYEVRSRNDEACKCPVELSERCLYESLELRGPCLHRVSPLLSSNILQLDGHTWSGPLQCGVPFFVARLF